MATYTTGASMEKEFKVYAIPGHVKVCTQKGFGTIYIDQERQPKAAIPGSEWTFSVEPGEHRITVEMGGRLYDVGGVNIQPEGVLVLSSDDTPKMCGN